MGKKNKIGHEGLVHLLYERLKEKPYVDEIFIEKEFGYARPDILTRQGKKWVCYEVKSNFSHKSYRRGTDQLCTFTMRFHPFDNAPVYGVYWSPQVMKLMYRDGTRL